MSSACATHAVRHETTAVVLIARASMIPDHEVTAATLRTFQMFADTPEQALQAVARAAMLRRVGRNAYVVRAGERTDFVYLILSGALNVLVSDEEGCEAILSVLGPGELFGEMGVLDDETRSATVVAVTPSVLVVLAKTEFKRCLRENFDVSRYVMRKLIQRLRMADRRIESLALLDVAGRVVRVLRDLAETLGGEQVVARKLSKQDIAKMVGASREMVSRVVKDLELRGLIEMGEGRIVLRDVGNA
jgi:CRP/FNR family cyclic AMP-dependent transcriptional regulator